MTTITTRLREGDQKAFTEMYHLHFGKLHGYLTKKTKSAEEATELVQIVFIKVWNFRHTLSEDFSFDTQLFHIARTCLVDYIRQQSIKKSRLAVLQLQQAAEAVDEDYASFESDNYLEALIQTLPPTRKKVFTLSRVEGLSHKEIAAELSITVNTVEDHMTKALRRIRTLITSFFW